MSTTNTIDVAEVESGPPEPTVVDSAQATTSEVRRRSWLVPVVLSAAGFVLLGGGFGIGYAVGVSQTPAGMGQFDPGQFPGAPGEGGFEGGPGMMPGDGQPPGQGGDAGGTETDNSSSTG
jgi:hypothetical protein